MEKFLSKLIIFAGIVLLLYFGAQIFLAGNSKLAGYYQIIKNVDFFGFLATLLRLGQFTKRISS